jgi:1-acyl-sn-glycerol-3-phosphate acyltransferase
MKHVRPWMAAVASALYWGFGGTAFLLIALVLRPILPAATARRIGLRLMQIAFQGFTVLLRLFGIATCEMVGFERLVKHQGGMIVAPNHPAIWDVVFIMSRVGGLTCILKTAILKNPLLAGGARLARFIPNDPPFEMVKRCVTELHAGAQLLLFPEGTRTRKKEGVVNAFRGGVAIIASQTRVPVFPVFIKTNSDYGSKGWPAWKPPLEMVRIQMTVGEPLVCSEEESSHAFLERLRAVYIAALSAPPDEDRRSHPQL